MEGFRAPALPQNPNIEDIRDDVLAGLNRAARDTGKGAYNKSSDSFAILEKLDPAKVRPVWVCRPTYPCLAGLG